MHPANSSTARAALLATLFLAAWPAHAADPVLIDLFRGQPSQYQPPYPNPNPYTYYQNLVVAGTTHRYDAVRRLITFANEGANRAVAVSGTTLKSSWPNLTFAGTSNPATQPSIDVLCEYPIGDAALAGQTNACRNWIQGAFLYTAVLMPAQGNYAISCVGNDGAVLDASSSQGTDYRNLGYSTKVASFCLAEATDGYTGNGPLPSPAPNTLVNIRVAWNNWGNDAALTIRWTPPGASAPVAIPASQLFDPSDPATYLAASNDDFTGTPLTAGTAGTTASVFSNDRVNVATPVSTGAGGNVQTYALIDDPVTSAPPPAGITLTADGTLSVAGTVAPGSHTVTYRICRTDTLPQPLCATAQATLQVNASIVPTVDNAPGPLPAGTAGTPIANVAVNDQVNGAPATLGTGGNATVAPSGAWPGGISLDADTGAVSVLPTVPAGNYSLPYTLCDRFGHCADSTVNFTLTAATLAAGGDSGSATAGQDSTPVANVAANDTINGQPVQLGAGGNATVATSGTWPAGITLDPATGAVQVAASVPPGQHTLSYQLCPLNGDPCVTATVTLQVVSAAGTVAVPTLGQWGLMLLGSLLLLPGLRRLRHRH